LHEDFVARLQFDHPGWDTSFDIEGEGEIQQLSFHWTMDHTAKDGKISLRTVAPVRADMDEDAFVQVAWYCVRMAVLHEAGEHFGLGDERPWHPHHHRWWEVEYRQGVGALSKDGT